jgi:hypothetical protein
MLTRLLLTTLLQKVYPIWNSHHEKLIVLEFHETNQLFSNFQDNMTLLQHQPQYEFRYKLSLAEFRELVTLTTQQLHEQQRKHSSLWSCCFTRSYSYTYYTVRHNHQLMVSCLS